MSVHWNHALGTYQNSDDGPDEIERLTAERDEARRQVAALREALDGLLTEVRDDKWTRRVRMHQTPAEARACAALSALRTPPAGARDSQPDSQDDA